MKKPRKLNESLAADMFYDIIDGASDEALQQAVETLALYKEKFNRTYMGLLRMPFFRDLVAMIEDESGYRNQMNAENEQELQAQQSKAADQSRVGFEGGESMSARKLTDMLAEETDVTPRV